MRLTRPLMFLIVGTLLSIGILRVSIVSMASAQNITGCASLSADGQVDPTQTVAFWNNIPITPQTALADTLTAQERKVLGVTSDEKWIEVDLSEQKLTAWQGDNIFLESLISSGLFGRTPIGEYRVWYKIRATKMEGGSKLNNTYYYLPNVPYTMFFHGDFGIHGTYWHQNFGTPMSHGCVNTPTLIAEKLFYWSDPQLPEGKMAVRSTEENQGTRIVVHE
jgi:lipoprotein-anchoring transpeptidase ErfK/SrfK